MVAEEGREAEGRRIALNGLSIEGSLQEKVYARVDAALEI